MALLAIWKKMPRAVLAVVDAASQRLNSISFPSATRWEYQLVNDIMHNNGHLQPQSSQDTEPASVFDEAILRMAVPKSKISPSRKRMKWQQHIPDRVEWSLCARCGEAKRPHRICTNHMDICAMRDEDWNAYKSKKDAEGNQWPCPTIRRWWLASKTARWRISFELQQHNE